MLATSTRRPGEERERAVPEVGELELKAGVSGILNRWPAVGLAVGVVRHGRLEFFHGHGLADIASNTPITEDTIFRIASITWVTGAVGALAVATTATALRRRRPTRSGDGPA